MRWISLLIVGAMLSGCAAYERAATMRREGSETKVVQGEKGKVELEVKKPQGTDLARISSPRRSASLEVVARGKEMMQRGAFDQALQTFQEAATLDGSNGIAYYYIARTHYELMNFEQAMGILDRAESLLAHSAAWLMSCDSLRDAIRVASAS